MFLKQQKRRPTGSPFNTHNNSLQNIQSLGCIGDTRDGTNTGEGDGEGCVL